MKTIVALPGGGIGVEVVDATCELLMGAGLSLKLLTPPQGNPLPEETKRAARWADGVLFGAAGPSTSNVVSSLRWEMGAWAGVRPIRFCLGMRAPLADPEGIGYFLKSNVLPRTDGLYQQIVERRVGEAGGLELEHFHVDDAARRLVRFPNSLDVVLCMNLYGASCPIAAQRQLAGSAWPPPGTSATVELPSSRCTDPPPTSQARKSPTPPLRSYRPL